MFFIAKINKKITFSPESSKKRCIQYIYKIISSKIFYLLTNRQFLTRTYIIFSSTGTFQKISQII